MNAVNALFREKQEAELEAAIEAANKWVGVARPIILASIELDRLDDTLWPLRQMGRRRDYEEAKSHIASAREELEDMLDGIRDDFLCDQRKSWDRSLGEDEGEAVDNFNEMLDEATVSVPDCIKQIEREDYAAFIEGDKP